MRPVGTGFHRKARVTQRLVTFAGTCGQRGVLPGLTEPEHPRRSRGRKGTEGVECHVERRGACHDRTHRFDRGGDSFIVDLAEEVHGDVEGFRSSPPNVGDPIAQHCLETRSGGERGISQRQREKASHPFGVEAGVGLGLGVGLGAVHGFPPALVSVTSIACWEQSVEMSLNSDSANQLGRSITLYGLPA